MLGSVTAYISWHGVWNGAAKIEQCKDADEGTRRISHAGKRLSKEGEGEGEQ